MPKLKVGRREIFVAVFIIALYFFLRLLQLKSLPIFTDEAIYLRWAQVALNDSNWRFISLTDGKQPLFIWLVMISMKFISDPIIAGRLVSVISGFLTLLGLWVLSYELFKSKRIAYLSSFIYVVLPFAQVVDRMALYDSLSGALTVWALYFAVRLVKKPQLATAYTLGFSIGLGALNKSTNFFSLYLLPITLFLFDFSSKKRWVRFFKWGVCVVVALLVSQFLYAILRLSPYFHMVEQKNALFIYPLSEWLQNPFPNFIGNLRGLTNWLFEYLTIFISVLIIASIFVKKYYREKAILFLYFLLPFLALAAFGRIVFPRFIFFMMLTLLPLAAFSLHFFAQYFSREFGKVKFVKGLDYVFIVAVVLVYPFYVSLRYAVDPVDAAISHADKEQYVNSWTAGWGVNESVDFLKNEAQRGEVYIATEGTFGLMPFALELYLVDNPNVTIKGFWPIGDTLPEEVVAQSKVNPTYIVFYQPQHINPPSPEHLELVQKTQMGDSKYFYRLYKVVGY